MLAGSGDTPSRARASVATTPGRVWQEARHVLDNLEAEHAARLDECSIPGEDYLWAGSNDPVKAHDGWATRRPASSIQNSRGSCDGGRSKSTVHPAIRALVPWSAATSLRGIATIAAAVGTNELARLRVTSTASAGRPGSSRYAHPVARTRASPIHSTRSTFPVQRPRSHVMSFGIEGSTAVKGVQSTAGRGDTYVNCHGSGY